MRCCLLRLLAAVCWLLSTAACRLPSGVCCLLLFCRHYKYLIIGGSNDFSNPKTETLPTGQNLADGRSLRASSLPPPMYLFLEASCNICAHTLGTC
jgi:hypothetical protein